MGGGGGETESHESGQRDRPVRSESDRVLAHVSRQKLLQESGSFCHARLQLHLAKLATGHSCNLSEGDRISFG